MLQKQLKLEELISRHQAVSEWSWIASGGSDGNRPCKADGSSEEDLRQSRRCAHDHFPIEANVPFHRFAIRSVNRFFKYVLPNLDSRTHSCADPSWRFRSETASCSAALLKPNDFAKRTRCFGPMSLNECGLVPGDIFSANPVRRKRGYTLGATMS